MVNASDTVSVGGARPRNNALPRAALCNVKSHCGTYNNYPFTVNAKVNARLAVFFRI